MIDISVQKNGVVSAIVNELIKYLTTLKYKEVRLGWVCQEKCVSNFLITC